MQITGQECSRLVNNGANGWSSCAMVLSSRMPGKRALNGASRAYVGFWFHCSPNPKFGEDFPITKIKLPYVNHKERAQGIVVAGQAA